MLNNSALLIKGVLASYEQAAREMNILQNKTYQDAFTIIPSTAAYENYGWLGNMPQLREWKGSKSAKALANHKYQVTNKDWEATLEIDRNEVEDDQLQAIRQRVGQLAQAGIKFPHILMSNLIINGASGLAYDSISFFNSVARAGQPAANQISGSGVTDVALTTDLATARANMMTFKDDNGEPMGITGDTIVCAPLLEAAFKRIIHSTTFASQANPGVINPWQSLVNRVIVDPRLVDTDDWYLLSTSYPIRPLIYQDRKAPVFVALDKPDSPEVFMRKKIYFGVETRGNSGYGFWQMAVMVAQD